MTVIDLRPREIWHLQELFARDRIAHCFAESRINVAVGPSAPQVWVTGGSSGRPESALLLGPNLVPIETTPQARAEFAERLAYSGRRCSSIVGPADEVLDLWRLLAPFWGPARDVRPDQPLLMIGQPSEIDPDPGVRQVEAAQVGDLMPASVAMFTEEVGYSPFRGGGEDLYRKRVADLVEAGYALARWERDSVVFKAEFGAITRHVAQVQGVWVAPSHRGSGLAEPAMSAVVRHGLSLAPVVSLYVNSFNTAALRTYRAVGFRQVGAFATVLF